MEDIKKQYPSPSDLNNLYGHTDLEGFSKYRGVNYDTLLEINRKNAVVIRKSAKGLTRFRRGVMILSVDGTNNKRQQNRGILS